MKSLKIFSTLSLLIALTALFACGDDFDPYKSKQTVNNDENSDPGSWPAPGIGGGGGGGGGKPDDNPLADKQKHLKDLDAQQTDALCAANYEKYKAHDNPTLAVGRGACFDFAARRGNLLGFDYTAQIQTCEDEFMECLAFPDQQEPEANCLNPEAQLACEATVEEFEHCGTEDAQLLTAYFLQLNNRFCTDHATDLGIIELNALLAEFEQPQACITLFTKCPKIFD